MGRRFSDIDSVYNRLVAADFNFSALPTNDELRKYAAWKQSPELRQLPDGAMPARGRAARVGVVAFGFPTDANEILVKMSNRALSAYNALSSGIKADLVLSASPSVDFVAETGFQPARCVIAQRQAGTTKTSNITGNRYKDTTAQTYTIPFGRKTATQTEFEAQAAIVAAADATHVVTFKAERLYRG